MRCTFFTISLVCLLVLVIISASILRFENFELKHLSNDLNVLQEWLVKPSLATDEYHIIQNVCLAARGQRKWDLLVPEEQRRKVIKLRNFLGGGDFVFEEFRIISRRTHNNPYNTRVTNKSLTRSPQMGTFLIITNTHANNFHIINDFLLPIFRVYQKTTLDGLLIPEGCEDCWKQQLPIQSMGIDRMNLTVLYPMEALISNITLPPMCFDQLIIKRYQGLGPYYMREGRFSKIWTAQLFIDFREFMQNLSHTDLPSSPQTNKRKGRNNDNGLKMTDGNPMENKTKPILSWMSRSSGDCTYRCITNKQDAVAELSKYFDVQVLDFSSGLTTDQAMAYIRKTDVLVGLHGAGLAFTAFLPDGAILVELRSEYSNRMFLNMASSLNIPYYALSLQGCVGPGKDNVYTLPPSLVLNMTEEIYNAYMYEKNKLANEGPNMTDGKCEFPHPVTPCGRLSTSNYARCYLHQGQMLNRLKWFQCAWHDVC